MNIPFTRALVGAMGLAISGMALAQVASGEPTAVEAKSVDAKAAEEKAAADNAAEFEVGTGFDLASGKYGGSVRVDELSVPLILRYQRGSMAYKLTLPYLCVSGPADAVPVERGVVICDDRSGTGSGSGSSGGSGSGSNSGRGSLDDCDDATGNVAAPRSTRSGLGDLQVEVAWAVPEFNASSTSVELVGKVKLGTASASKGLGTGKNSYSLQADVAQPFGNFSLLGGLGYTVYQRVPSANLKNTPFGSLGGKLQFGDDTSVKLVYDHRRPLEAGAVHSAELTFTLEHEFSSAWRMEACALKGLTDASADLWAGLVIARRF